MLSYSEVLHCTSFSLKPRRTGIGLYCILPNALRKQNDQVPKNNNKETKTLSQNSIHKHEHIYVQVGEVVMDNISRFSKDRAATNSVDNKEDGDGVVVPKHSKKERIDDQGHPFSPLPRKKKRKKLKKRRHNVGDNVEKGSRGSSSYESDTKRIKKNPRRSRELLDVAKQLRIEKNTEGDDVPPNLPPPASTTESLLLSLCDPILSHIVSYLDEESLYECENLSLLLHQVIRNGKHWEEVLKRPTKKFHNYDSYHFMQPSTWRYEETISDKIFRRRHMVKLSCKARKIESIHRNSYNLNSNHPFGSGVVVRQMPLRDLFGSIIGLRCLQWGGYSPFEISLNPSTSPNICKCATYGEIDRSIGFLRLSEWDERKRIYRVAWQGLVWLKIDPDPNFMHAIINLKVAMQNMDWKELRDGCAVAQEAYRNGCGMGYGTTTSAYGYGTTTSAYEIASNRVKEIAKNLHVTLLSARDSLLMLSTKACSANERRDIGVTPSHAKPPQEAAASDMYQAPNAAYIGYYGASMPYGGYGGLAMVPWSTSYGGYGGLTTEPWPTSWIPQSVATSNQGNSTAFNTASSAKATIDYSGDMDRTPHHPAFSSINIINESLELFIDKKGPHDYVKVFHLPGYG